MFKNGVILPLALLIVGIMMLIALIFNQFYEVNAFVMNRSKKMMEGIGLANKAIREVLRRQNDDASYLFDENNYEEMMDEYATLKMIELFNDEGDKEGVAIIKVKPNPLKERKLSYKLEISAEDTKHVTKMLIELEIGMVDLTEYQYYDEKIFAADEKFYSGKVYAPQINVQKDGVNFWNKVEYWKELSGDEKANFLGGSVNIISSYPKLDTIVDFNKYKESAKTEDVCGAGIGFYIGEDAMEEYVKVITELFKIGEGSYFIDLSRLRCIGNDDYIMYDGNILPRYDGSSGRFNGVIYVDGDLHIRKKAAGVKNEDKNLHKDLGDMSRYEDRYGNCNILIITKPGCNVYVEDDLLGLEQGGSLYLVSGGIYYISYPKVNVINASMLAVGENQGYSVLLIGDNRFNIVTEEAVRLSNGYRLRIVGNMVLAGMSMLDIFAGEDEIVQFYYDDKLVKNKNICYPSIPIWREKVGTYRILWEDILED